MLKVHVKLSVKELVPFHHTKSGYPVLREPLKGDELTQVKLLDIDANLPDGRCIIGKYTDNENVDRIITFKEDGTFLPSGKPSNLDLMLAIPL